MIDQFVSEGVLIPDISCSHASPLVIVHKKEGGIRMAVDYREVNQFLKVSANQLQHTKIYFFISLEVSYTIQRWISYGDITNSSWIHKVVG